MQIGRGQRTPRGTVHQGFLTSSPSSSSPSRSHRRSSDPPFMDGGAAGYGWQQQHVRMPACFRSADAAHLQQVSMAGSLSTQFSALPHPHPPPAAGQPTECVKFPTENL